MPDSTPQRPVMGQRDDTAHLTKAHTDRPRRGRRVHYRSSRLPALDDVFLWESPAIAITGRNNGQRRGQSMYKRQAGRRTAAMMGHDHHVDRCQCPVSNKLVFNRPFDVAGEKDAVSTGSNHQYARCIVAIAP